MSMKDPKDTATIDALETPQRGRPKSGNALSNAEKQRAYRERKKSEKSSTVVLTLHELKLCGVALQSMIERMEPATDPILNELRDRLYEQWQRARAKDPE